jgi:ABC-type Fe3+ transport system permease subunit
MWVWPALLIAPMLALGELSAVFALATPLCQRQAGEWLHAVSLLFIALAALLTWLSWREARRQKQAHGGAIPTDTDRHGPQRLFLARVATWSGALSMLVLIGLWIPVWGLSPCWS